MGSSRPLEASVRINEEFIRPCLRMLCWMWSQLSETIGEPWGCQIARWGRTPRSLCVPIAVAAACFVIWRRATRSRYSSCKISAV